MKLQPRTKWFGNAIGILVAVYLLVALGGTIKKNFDLGKQINQMQGQISQLEGQRQQLAFQLQYYQTSSYQEREAKSKLGLVMPGENEIILPSPSPTAQPSVKDSSAKPHKSNLQQWLDFLSGKGA